MDVNSIGALLRERRPDHSLPQGLYNGQAALDFDMEAIFARSWLMVGLDCELPRSGSYLSAMVGNWPILIVRDRAGVIRAFHNSCRHRGSLICKAGSGMSPKLVCPYHKWTYDLDGTLQAATRMPEGFDRAGHGLIPVTLRNVDGALFICLGDDPPEFDDFASRLSAYVAPHRLKDTKLAFQSTLIEQANWKLVMENGRECYHCGTGHPELARSFPVGMSKHFDTGGDLAARKFATEMAANELAMDAVEGDWWQLARFRLNDGCSTISMDGRPVVSKPLCSLNGGNIGSMRLAVDPHCFVHATSDHVFMFSAMPVGPSETHVVGKWFVHKDAVEGVDYDIGTLTDLWTRTNLQDKELSENNQAGVNSRSYVPGPYSQEAEMLAQRFTDWYCRTATAYVDAHG